MRRRPPRGTPLLSTHVALTNDLKYRWAKGDLSSSAVQSLSANAQRQGARNLEKRSAAGTYCKHAKNLSRDISNLLGHPIGAPLLDWIEIPMKGNRKTAHPIYWPHKFFQNVAHYRDDIFRSRLIGLDGAADQFWQSIAGSDYVRNHPFLPRGAWGILIPIGMHGDGGIQQARFPIHPSVEQLSLRWPYHTIEILIYGCEKSLIWWQTHWIR